MNALTAAGIAIASYLALVIAFELLVATVGRRHAGRGLESEENWLSITASVDGSDRTVVVASVKSAGQIYVSANHWPRAWYHRVVANPDVRVTFRGKQRAYRATPVRGEERSRIQREYRLPVIVRILSGFPPRAFLRLDPVAPEPAAPVR